MKQFGGKVTKELKAIYEQSPNWKKGKFENLEETSMDINFQSLPKLMYKQIFDTEGRMPKENLPIQPFIKEEFLTPSEEAKIIWYGHSVVLMRINNKTILIDPMLGPDAAPIAPFASKRFSKDAQAVIDQLPEIDLMLLTHDHYDHLDLESIKQLKGKTKKYFAAIGVKRHLVSWAIPEEDITSFDWWDSEIFDDLQITFTPTRHFSGRGLTDRAKSLWGGWVIKSTTQNIWFSGDSGYGEHFKEIGNRLGPFDFAFMECGQYNENWHQIHMYPEESVKAAIDTNVTKVMAVHWAGFALAQHHWAEPINRFSKEAAAKNLELASPKIGQQFTVSAMPTSKWWQELS
ncbi:MAG: L-ascorbate metabolism protein UlaG (beta-lactamase superfamily), partial [Cyclobacteriaceae bacterium]|jgi:L-ascorbate metabolism protein UlaG (beta-lactamase superfamily)